MNRRPADGHGMAGGQSVASRQTATSRQPAVKQVVTTDPSRKKLKITLRVEPEIHEYVQRCAKIERTSDSDYYILAACGRVKSIYKVVFVPGDSGNETKRKKRSMRTTLPVARPSDDLPGAGAVRPAGPAGAAPFPGQDEETYEGRLVRHRVAHNAGEHTEYVAGCDHCLRDAAGEQNALLAKLKLSPSARSDLWARCGGGGTLGSSRMILDELRALAQEADRNDGEPSEEDKLMAEHGTTGHPTKVSRCPSCEVPF